MPMRKILFNSKLYLSQIIGMILFSITSFIHDGFDTTRTIDTYYIPLTMGFIVGTTFGLMMLIIQYKNKQEQQSLFHIIEMLANSLDERDKYTLGHSRRVTNLSLALGEKIGLTSEDIELLRLASILHDIGKIGVPDSILQKPDKLTEKEYDSIKQHPGKGEHILSPMQYDYKISKLIPIIKHHHERYDGKGYPDRLIGKHIPFLSRIISIADSFDAMTTDRPYRKGLNKNEALSKIEQEAGKQFDNHLANEFISLMQKYGESECQILPTCEIFTYIQNEEISVAYKEQFCHGIHQYCARYKLKDTEELPTNLLPDGSLLPIDGKAEKDV